MVLKDKVALITGAATGIGEATAIRFAKEGAKVAINYFTQPEEAEKTKEAVKRSCEAADRAGCEYLLVQADVSKTDEVDDMVQQVIEKWGRIDILVNNAGMQIQSPSHDMTYEDLMKVLSVDLIGPFLTSQAVIRHFLSRDGEGIILNNSSVHQLIPKPGFIGYSMAKGGVENLTRTLALEYAGRGIRVNAVAPGAIATPINPWSNDEDARKRVESHIPQGRAGESEEIAAVFSFLASADAAYITGQTIYVDGGLSLYPDFKDDWSS